MHQFLETKMQSCYPVTVISEIVTGSTMTFSKREHGIGADNIVMGEMYFVGLPFVQKIFTAVLQAPYCLNVNQ